MFENPRRGRRARNFTTNVPKILGLKSSSGQIFSDNWRWVPLLKGLWHEVIFRAKVVIWCPFPFAKCSCRVMKKKPDKFHQWALTIITYIKVIFAAIAFKIENVCPTFPCSCLTSVETDGRKQFHKPFFFGLNINSLKLQNWTYVWNSILRWRQTLAF